MTAPVRETSKKVDLCGWSDGPTVRQLHLFAEPLGGNLASVCLSVPRRRQLSLKERLMSKGAGWCSTVPCQ